MFVKYFLLLLFVVSFINIHVVAKPTENNIKNTTVDVPIEIINSTSIRVPTRWQKGMERFGQIMDAIRFGTGRLVNLGMMARNEIAHRAEEFTSEAANAILSLIAARDARQHIQKTTQNQIKQQQQRKRSTSETSTVSPAQSASFNIIPPVTRETVRLEKESGQSLLEIPQSVVLEGLAQSRQSTPVVDRTKENDKYGNVGSRNAGRVIITGVEGLSSLVNRLLELPGNTLQQFSKTINEALNQFGQRLIGLA